MLHKSAEDVRQSGDCWSGLSSADAAARLRQFGSNEIGLRDRHNLFRILRDALREPLLLLLVGTSAIYFALGDTGEAVMLAGLTIIDLGIVVYQDRKTERVLETLQDLASPRALVVRDGVQSRIAGRDVVPGDILIVGEGDRVAADAELLSASELRADESLLTGESVPVDKTADTSSSNAAAGDAGDRPSFLFSGSMIVHGQGIGRVIATGTRSQVGHIGTSLHAIAFEETRLRGATRRLTRDFAVMGAIVSILVIALQGIRLGDWLAAMLAGITTAMAMMPEEIPVVLTVFMALGAWRISRRHVLTRRISAIENLGAATVLCTDKTGTLTVNQMTVTRLDIQGQTTELASDTQLTAAMRSLLKTAALASEMLPTDPMERAFHTAAADRGLQPAERPLRIYGLTPTLLAVTHVRRGPAAAFTIAVKGAPEAIAALCGLSESARGALLHRASLMAEDGLRVLAIAEGVHDGPLPDAPTGFSLSLLGLAALSDPVRETVPAAVAECRKAGIRVMMITGDYPGTAKAIARSAGIDGTAGVISGQAIDTLDDSQLTAVLRTANVFARVTPQQKLRLVSVLKASGEVVAMTGDGVNDAPALKAADVGIAMGKRGADVAREAAAIVLLDDAFESIVAAIRLGRRIFDNLRKALSYILAVHVPIAGVALAPLLAGWPIVFSPVHIVFLELVIDPVCSIAFEAEPEESDTMRRPPRAPGAPLFGRRDILMGLALGTAGLVGILGVYAFALNSGIPEARARTIAFAGVIMVNLALIFASRRRRSSFLASFTRSNPILWTIAGAATVTLLFAVYLTPVSKIFDFAPLTGTDVALVFVPGVLTLALAAITRNRGA